MKYPTTPAIRVLRKHGVDFEPFLYRYEEKGGTAASANALNVAESQVVKTLIMEDDTGKPLVVLMTGDRQVSTKALARELSVKSISPCQPKVAQKHSGYQVGGTSPFGTRTNMPVVMEATILELPQLYINGGKRGFLIRIEPSVLVDILKPRLVSVGIET